MTAEIRRGRGVLAGAHRLTDGRAIQRVVRTGRKCGSGTVVVHVLADPLMGGSRIAFVVSKAVGNAVTRNRVKRRLRHVSSPLVKSLPSGWSVVVRALPSSSEAGVERLAGDLVSCLARAGLSVEAGPA